MLRSIIPFHTIPERIREKTQGKTEQVRIGKEAESRGTGPEQGSSVWVAAGSHSPLDSRSYPNHHDRHTLHKFIS